MAPQGPPPRPSANPISSVPSSANIAPRVTSTAVDTSEKAATIFRKRRSGLWAAAIAIVVGAGSLIGAQMKSNQQAREKFAEHAQDSQRELDSKDGTEIIQSPVKTTPVNRPDDTTEVKAVQMQPVDNAPAATIRGMSYNQRQISFLEDRRGVLMKERFDLEKKIERVREKKKREEEIESRRGTGIASGR